MSGDVDGLEFVEICDQAWIKNIATVGGDASIGTGGWLADRADPGRRGGD